MYIYSRYESFIKHIYAHLIIMLCETCFKSNKDSIWVTYDYMCIWGCALICEVVNTTGQTTTSVVTRTHACYAYTGARKVWLVPRGNISRTVESCFLELWKFSNL